MGNNTKTGLLLIIVGMILSIVSSAVLFLSQGLLDIGIIGGFLTLIGLIFMFIGRKEFGNRHRKFVIGAIILFIITIIVAVIFVFFIVFAVMSTIDYDSASIVDFSPFKNLFLMTPIIAVIGGITNVFLVHELEDQKGKLILYLAFFVTLFLSFYIAFEGMKIADEWIEDIDKTLQEERESSLFYFDLSSTIGDQTTEFQQKLSRISAIGIIGQLFYLVAYLLPYNRIKSGDLAPSLPSHQKRCMSCGRVNPYDSYVCAYCGSRFMDPQDKYSENLTGGYNNPKNGPPY